MIEINHTDYADEAYKNLSLSYSEIEYIVALLKTREDLPETIREEILPIMEDFLIKEKE